MGERESTVAGSGGVWQAALRRRRFVVDRRYQFRAAFFAVAVAMLLLLLLNLSLLFTSRQSAEAAKTVAPEFSDFIEAQDRVQMGLVATGSIVFLVGVFLVSILESHRTAGAAFKIGRALDRIRDGRLDVRLKLRRGDNLHELASAANGMAGALHERAWQDVEALEAIAARAEQAHGEPAAHEAARAIRAHVATKRRVLE